MSNGIISVVTPTVGNGSPHRLRVLLREMREFTKLDYQHVVVDDGTISKRTRDMQREICKSYGVEYVENTPPFGAPTALNCGFDRIKTQWGYVVDDGTRPSSCWLEAAVDFVRNIGSKTWNNRSVAMAGTPSISAHILAFAGVFGKDRNTEDYLQSDRPWSCQVIDDFYGDWNDGLWSWHRLAPLVWKRLVERHSTTLFDNQLIGCLSLLEPPGDTKSPLFRVCLSKIIHPNHLGGFWPHRRHAVCDYRYCQPLTIINVKHFKGIGGFHKKCWNYDGHLAIRFGLAGLLVLSVDLPTWLHLNYQASFDALPDAHQPREQITEDAYLHEFGMNSDKVANLVDRVIPFAEQIEINRLLYANPLNG